MAVFAKFSEHSACRRGGFVRSHRFWYTVYINVLFKKSDRRLAVGCFAETCRRPFTVPVHRE